MNLQNSGLKAEECDYDHPSHLEEDKLESDALSPFPTSPDAQFHLSTQRIARHLYQ
jgi:hypothetical protein